MFSSLTCFFSVEGDNEFKTFVTRKLPPHRVKGLMDDLFKRKLLKLRQGTTPTSFADAVYGDLEFPIEPEVLKTPQQPQTFTEKEQILTSLEQFAQEKIRDTDGSLKFPGGEIALKAVPGWEDIQVPQSIHELKERITLDQPLAGLSFELKQTGQLKVLFVTESFRPWDQVSPELSEGFINEMLCAFPLKTAELFMRMLLAMKLTPPEVLLYPSEKDGESIAQEVMEVAAFFNPEVIVTLGAKATHRILKTNDRLSMVHGQFFQRQMGASRSVQVVPLFHPSIIENSPGMKKTAWVDMQKIMKHLKKL